MTRPTIITTPPAWLTGDVLNTLKSDFEHMVARGVFVLHDENLCRYVEPTKMGVESLYRLVKEGLEKKVKEFDKLAWPSMGTIGPREAHEKLAFWRESKKAFDEGIEIVLGEGDVLPPFGPNVQWGTSNVVLFPKSRLISVQNKDLIKEGTILERVNAKNYSIERVTCEYCDTPHDFTSIIPQDRYLGLVTKSLRGKSIEFASQNQTKSVPLGNDPFAGLANRTMAYLMIGEVIQVKSLFEIAYLPNGLQLSRMGIETAYLPDMVRSYSCEKCGAPLSMDSSYAP